MLYNIYFEYFICSFITEGKSYEIVTSYLRRRAKCDV